jgi:hypothetical protein
MPNNINVHKYIILDTWTTKLFFCEESYIYKAFICIVRLLTSKSEGCRVEFVVSTTDMDIHKFYQHWTCTCLVQLAKGDQKNHATIVDSSEKDFHMSLASKLESIGATAFLNNYRSTIAGSCTSKRIFIYF